MTHLIKLFMAFICLSTQVIAVERISIPQDVQPGFEVKKSHSNGQSFHLGENEISPHFTLLNDRSLISTRKLARSTKQPVNQMIEEEFDVKKILKPHTIHVRERHQMLTFPKPAYNGYIYENESPGTLVEIVGNLLPLNAIGNISYLLIGSDNFRLFHKTNVLSIISTKRLDREIQSGYALHLLATDSEGYPASTLINVSVKDVNDNPPVFVEKYYTWNITTECPRYTLVGIVRAVDADGDKPVYRVVDSSNNHTVVVLETGEIVLMQKPEVDVYSLLIQANDNRTPMLYSDIIPVIVRVSGLDNEDVIEKPLKGSKSSIRQTRVHNHFFETDGSRPGKVMFRLESVHPGEVFNLQNENRWIDVDHNGDVKVKEPWDYEQLEREKTIDFWVQIRAPGQLKPDRQRIIIRVQDANDENPHFINDPMPMQAVVQLNAPSGTPVFKLQARDPDLNSDIHYFMYRDRTGGRFEVDEMSGEVSTLGNDPFMLDREYVIYVKAEDMKGKKVTGEGQSSNEERLSIFGGRRPLQSTDEKLIDNIKY